MKIKTASINSLNVSDSKELFTYICKKVLNQSEREVKGLMRQVYPTSFKGDSMDIEDIINLIKLYDLNFKLTVEHPEFITNPIKPNLPPKFEGLIDEPVNEALEKQRSSLKNVSGVKANYEEVKLNEINDDEIPDF